MSAEPHIVFAALGDPTRLALLGKLSAGERRSLAALAADTRMTRQAVAKHLGVLEQAGLVSRARNGRESHYAFQPAQLSDAQAYLQSVSDRWEDALTRLKAFVDTPT